MHVALPLYQTEPYLQILAVPVEQAINQGTVVRLPQDVMQTYVRNEKIMHNHAQFIAFALTASGVPMEIFNGAPEFSADIRQRYAVAMLPRRVGLVVRVKRETCVSGCCGIA